MRFPFDDQLPGASSPPGFDVIWVSPPPSEARIVWMPFWLPSSLNVSQSSSVPSGDGLPHGLKSPGYCPSMMREVPSSGLMIHEPPPGSGQQVAMWAPSGNQRGNSPVSVAPCMSRSPVPSGLTTYAWVSLSAGLNRANVSMPFVPGGFAAAENAATPARTTTQHVTIRNRRPNEDLIRASPLPRFFGRGRRLRRSPQPCSGELDTNVTTGQAGNSVSHSTRRRQHRASDTHYEDDRRICRVTERLGAELDSIHIDQSL